MNSSTLKENGFAEFVSIKRLPFCSLPYNKGGVLVLSDTTVTAKPSSDVLYIGRSKNLAKRVFGGYLGGYGRKGTGKINSKLLNDGYIEKVAVSWILSDNPKVAQQELLESFKKEHGKYPAWNAPAAKVGSQKSPPKPKISKKRPATKPVKSAP